MNTNLLSVLIVLILLQFNMSAQTNKGAIRIGNGNILGFTKYSQAQLKPDLYDKSFNLSLSPSFGYFVTNRIVTGFSFPLYYNSSKTSAHNFSHNSYYKFEYSIHPFVRYYITKTKLKPYIHADCGFGLTKTVYDYEYDYSLESKDNIFSMNFIGGAEYFINNIISLDIGIGYSENRAYFEETRIDRGMYFNLGFSFYLNNKSKE